MEAPGEHVPDPAPARGRWILFGGVYLVYFAFGVVALSIPPLVGEVRADLGLSRSALGAWQLVYLGSAPPAGRLVDRLGVRRAITIGALIVIASGVLRAMAGNLLALWAAIALFGLQSGAALATVVGVLVEVPLMLMLVKIANRTRDRFPA
jgi:MFS family permease